MREESKQLGLNYGTACNRLRKMILLYLLKESGKNLCFRCNKPIETIKELSVEHKKQWLNVDVVLFWDLNNIAFSHLGCNSRSVRRKSYKHGTVYGYDSKNCRCSLCRNAVKLRRQQQRANWKLRGKKRSS